MAVSPAAKILVGALLLAVFCLACLFLIPEPVRPTAGPPTSRPEGGASTPSGAASPLTTVRFGAESPRRGAGRVTGIVNDVARRPIAGAEVELLSLRAAAAKRGDAAGDVARAVVQCDERGQFELASPLAAGRVRLVARARDFRPATVDVDLPAENVELVLLRGSVLVVRVRDEGLVPIGDAEIQWTGLSGACELGGTARTGADGAAVLEGLPESVDLVVTSFSRVPAVRSLVLSRARQECDVVLCPGRRLRGRVVDGESRAPLTGVPVESWIVVRGAPNSDGVRSGAARRLATAMADEDGGFEIISTPAEVGAESENGIAGVWIDVPDRAPAWFPLPAAAPREGIEIALVPRGRLAGRIVDAAGAPVSGLRVWARSRDFDLVRSGTPSLRIAGGDYFGTPETPAPTRKVAPFHGRWEATTDAEGHYDLDGVAAVSGGTEVTVAIVGAPGSPAVSVSALPARTTSVPDLVFERSAHYRDWIGTVVDPEGRGIASARVSIGGRETTTATDGGFVLASPRRSASRYCRVVARGFRELRDVVPEGPEGARVPLRLVLARASSLVVRVVDRQDAPFEGVEVRAVKAGALASPGNRDPIVGPLVLARATTDVEGYARLDGIPDAVDVLASLVDARGEAFRAVRSAGLPAADAGPLVLRIADVDASTRLSEARVVVVDSRTGVRVTGPVRGVLHHRGLLVTAEVARGAVLRFPRVPAGTYELELLSEGVGGASFVVAFDAELPERTVAIGGGGRVEGRVALPDGSAAPSVGVFLVGPDGRLRGSTRSDSDGRFRLDGVAKGEYEAFAAEVHDPLVVPSTPSLSRQGSRSRVVVSEQDCSVDLLFAPGSRLLLEVPLPPAIRSLVEGARGAGDHFAAEWANGLRFTVSDARGSVVAVLFPTAFDGGTAKLEAPLAPGSYHIAIESCGNPVGTLVVPTDEPATFVW